MDRIAAAFAILASAAASAQEPGYETLVVGDEEDAGVPSAYVSTVRPEDDPRAGVTVSEALDALPSVRVRSIGGFGSFATVSIRGSTGSQVRILLDGVPLATASAGASSVGDLSLESFESIRVHRGAAPPAIGGGAIGGVVELRTPEPGRRPRFESEITLGSFDTLRLSALEVGRLEGARYSAFAGASWARNDFAYHGDNGTPQNPEDDRTTVRENADFTGVDGGLGVAASPAESWLVESGASLHARDQGLPVPGAFQTRAARSSGERALGRLALTRLVPGGSFGLRLQGRVHRDLLDDPEGEIAPAPQRTDHLTLAAAPDVLTRLRLGPGELELMTGFEWERFRPRGGLARIEGAPTRTVLVGAVSWSWAFARGRVIVTPMLRLRAPRDSFAAEAAGPVDRVEPADPQERLLASPRAGVRVEPVGDLAVRASAGLDRREPTFVELFGDGGTVQGNPELRPESAWTADAGVAWAPRRAGPLFAPRVEAGVFRSEATDLVQLVQSSARTVAAVNLERTRIDGAEASAETGLPGGLGVRLAYTLMDARWTSDTWRAGRRIPGRPLHDARVVVEERAGAVRLAIDADVVSGNFLDPNNRIETPTRVLFGASAGFAPRFARGVSVAVSVRNVFDRRVEDVPDSTPGVGGEVPGPIADQLGFPLPGRSVTVTLRYLDQVH